MLTASIMIVPPRPNPGPEALEDRALGIGSIWILAGTLIALGMVLAISFILIRFGSRRKSLKPLAVARLPETATSATDLTSLVREVRSVLAEQFGDGIRARTTEELAADSTIAQSLGAEGSSNLVAFLRATDVMRFGSTGRDDDQDQRLIVACSDWAAGFFLAAGARSMTKGK